MSAKKWTIIFIVAIIGFMGVFMSANYALNAVGYFDVEKEVPIWDYASYERASKIKFIKAHENQYTGFIIGGSKSGTVRTSKLEECTNEKWYNLSVSSPNFHEYYLYVKWLSENTNAKKVVLYLSGHEVLRKWSEETNSTTKPTEIVSGNKIDTYLEKLYYLTLDVETNIEYAETKKENEKLVKEANRAIFLYEADTGMRLYESYNQCSNIESLNSFIQTNILNEYQDCLHNLFETDKHFVSTNENIENIKKIVTVCNNNDIELTVVLGPTFISELELYESPEFYTYLRRLVDVTEIWDFGGINSVNLNPYNFINSRHCNYATNDVVVETIYGREKHRDDFGVLLTSDNIDEYLQDRKVAYEKAATEYENTGTVLLQDLQDNSYLGEIK